MPYTADISRANPACFLFLLDQSGSMEQALSGQPGFRKMDQAAIALNGILNALSLRCSQGMDVRDYFHIGVIGYNTDNTGAPTVRSALQGTSSESPFLLVSQVVELAEVEDRQVKEPDGAGGLVEVTRKVPIWFRPHAEYGTPMCEALGIAAASLRTWTGEHPDSFPPIVINISDGMATDGEPQAQADEIMGLSTSDGNTLLFNIHLSETAAVPIQYPDNEDGLPDEHSRTLFRMSSPLPESSRAMAVTLDLSVNENSRGFVFNANMESLVQFLDIGTRGPSNVPSDLH